MSFLRDMVTRVWGEPVENLQPNVIVDPDNSTYIMHVNSDGSINAGIVSGESTSTAINDGTTTSQKAAVSAGGALKVDNSAVTQPVSASSLPLPTGAATSANQSTANTSLSNIDTSTAASKTDLDAINAAMGTQGDSAWSGTGNGTEISILKKVAANQAGAYNVQFLSPQTVQGNYSETTGLSASALNAYLIQALDVHNYRWWSLHISGTWSGTLTFSASNDGTNFNQIQCNSYGSLANSSPTQTTNAIYCGAIGYHYLQVQMTSYSSGTANAVLDLFTDAPPFGLNSIFSAQTGTWTVQPGNTANTTPWLVTRANNNASVPAGAGNTVIKASAGQLATLVVTTAGTGSGNVQIFDNATTNSGTPLFAFPATVSVAQFYQIEGWAKNGITAQNVTNGPVFTVYYS